MTTGRIRRGVAVGAVLAALLGAGVVAAWGTPAGGTVAAASAPASARALARARQETTDTGTTVTGTTATGTIGRSSGDAGSWWAFGLVLLGLAGVIGGIFFWDLYKTNRRQDQALEFVERNPQLLSESDRARVLDKLTTGTQGLTRGLLGFSLIGLFAIALLYLLIRNPNITNSDVVQNAMAALVTLVTAVVSFYFGTRSAQTSVPSPSPGEKPEEEPPRGELPPAAPTNVVATAADASASVMFDAPGDDGGSPITGYTVTASAPGEAARMETGVTSPIVVSGLTNGVEYTFTVRASNAVGDGPESNPSPPVTPP